MRKAYKTDLTDAQWALVEPLIPPAKRGGRPRELDMREVVNAILYQARTGVQWEMLPHDLLPKSTVFDYFSAWERGGAWQEILDALREAVRVLEGRDPTPSMACVDSQPVKATPVGGAAASDKAGYDGGKMIKGRKRHIAVDTLGLLLAVTVTAANLDDGTAAPSVLGRLLGRERFPRLERVLGDNKYNNKSLDAWLEGEGRPFEVEVRVKAEDAKPGFVPVKKRWVVERAIACLNRSRRLSRDFGRTTRSSEAWVKVSAIARLLRRAAPDTATPIADFMHPRKAKPEPPEPALS